MGLGDQLMATGMARGARARGKRIAFGDGRRILWDKGSAEIFRGNPNIAAPGSEGAADLEWIGYYKGSRIYNSHDRAGNRWIWNREFRPIAGEVVFDAGERAAGSRYGDDFILIEPNVPGWKSSAANKDWGFDRYQAVADRLLAEGRRVAQFRHDPAARVLGGVVGLETRGFRDALSILAYATLYVGPEGGLHHGAAAVQVPGVVLFGGFIPPAVTGYPIHTNLTGGAEACGSLGPCGHCRQAMAAIAVADVHTAIRERLQWST